MLGQFLPVFAVMFNPALYILFSAVMIIGGLSIAIASVVIFMIHFAFRVAEIFILVVMGQVMIGFYVSPLDGIAIGIVKRLFTIIIFAFFMIIGLAGFLALVASIYTMQIHPLFGFLLLIAAFLTLGKLKGLISDLINEKSSFDSASWKTVPSALIVKREANRMQSKYMESRKNSGGTRNTGGGTTLVTKGGSEKSSTPKIKAAPTKTRFNPSSKI
jgi:hypothetical protein